MTANPQRARGFQLNVAVFCFFLNRRKESRIGFKSLKGWALTSLSPADKHGAASLGSRSLKVGGWRLFAAICTNLARWVQRLKPHHIHETSNAHSVQRGLEVGTKDFLGAAVPIPHLN